MTVGRQKVTLLQETRCPFFVQNSTEEQRGDHFRFAFYPYPSPFAVYPVIVFSKTFNIHKDTNRNTATGMYGWRPHEIKLCLIAFLNLFLMLSILVKGSAGSRILFITLIPPLWAYVQSLFLQFLIVLMPVLDVRRCFRYAGCLGSTWNATGSILQGDLVRVVILNCVLRPC